MKVEDIKQIQEIFRDKEYMKAFATAQAKAQAIENEKIRIVRMKEQYEFLIIQANKSKKEKKEFEYLEFVLKFHQ